LSNSNQIFQAEQINTCKKPNGFKVEESNRILILLEAIEMGKNCIEIVDKSNMHTIQILFFCPLSEICIANSCFHPKLFYILVPDSAKHMKSSKRFLHPKCRGQSLAYLITNKVFTQELIG
jgi:hypothetical protein